MFTNNDSDNNRISYQNKLIKYDNGISTGFFPSPIDPVINDKPKISTLNALIKIFGKVNDTMRDVLQIDKIEKIIIDTGEQTYSDVKIISSEITNKSIDIITDVVGDTVNKIISNPTILIMGVIVLIIILK